MTEKIEFKYLRLDQLNLGFENLRERGAQELPHADEILTASIEEHGILSPFIVNKSGKGEYIVWDGTRRYLLMKKSGKSGATQIPAYIYDADDVEGIALQININQYRQSLSSLSEAEAVRQLKQDRKISQSEIAKILIKSEAWVSQRLKVWELPKTMLTGLRDGRIHFSQALVIADYVKDKKIMQMLYREAGNGISSEDLQSMGDRALEKGTEDAMRFIPQKIRSGQKSWFNIKMRRKSYVATLHIDYNDDPKEITRAVDRYLREIISS